MVASADKGFAHRILEDGHTPAACAERPITHAVPDKSMKNMVLDLSDLHGTNVWLGESELVKPCAGTDYQLNQEGLIEWMNRGCNATVLPLDGKDRLHIEWLSETIRHTMRGLQDTDGKRRLGLAWKWCDGEDSDQLASLDAYIPHMSGNTYDSVDRTAKEAFFKHRRNSRTAMPHAVAWLKSVNDVDVVLKAVVDTDKMRIRDDCVISLVLCDSFECTFSMLHFVFAQSRVSFLNLVSLVEEIGQLHRIGRAGDFRMQCGQLTDLNKLASIYLDGNTKLYVMAYPEQDDFSYVDDIVSVCARDQTVRMDIVWIDPSDLPTYENSSFNSDNEIPLGLSDAETNLRDSPSIVSIRESLKARTSEHLSAAARRAMNRVLEEESPTNPKSEAQKTFPERRMLQFPSIQSPLPQYHEGNRKEQERWIQVDRSRDVFSSLRTIRDETRTNSLVERNDDIESVSLKRPTESADEHDIPEFVESEETSEHTGINELTGVDSQTSVKETVYKDIEAKVNEKLLLSMKDLQQRFECSEMRRHELEALVKSLQHGLSPSLHQVDHESLIKALSEQMKFSKNLENVMSTMKQEKLAQEVEIATKNKELVLARARIEALQRQSDAHVAYEMCEHEVRILQDEVHHLRAENIALMKKVATLEVSDMLQSNCPILPEDEDYDVNGAEGRIIYRLNEKIKALHARLSRNELENADLRKALEQAKRDERKTIVTKKVAQDALAKLSHVTKKAHAMGITCL